MDLFQYPNQNSNFSPFSLLLLTEKVSSIDSVVGSFLNHSFTILRQLPGLYILVISSKGKDLSFHINPSYTDGRLRTEVSFQSWTPS